MRELEDLEKRLLCRRHHPKPAPPPPPPPVKVPAGVVLTAPTVCFLNQSNGAVSDQEITAALPDFQAQCNEFGAQWFMGAELAFRAPLPGEWVIRIEDQASVARALGFHEELNGVPTGHIFAGFAKQNGVPWTGVASHELLEMIGDPRTVLAAVVDPNGDGKSGQIVMAECCDAVEQSVYTEGATQVSDFVYPAWWDTTAAGPFDHLGLITAPLQLQPGGSYIGLINFTSANGWEQRTAHGESW